MRYTVSVRNMDLHVYDINHLLLALGEAWKVTKSNVHDHQSFFEGRGGTRLG